MTDTQAPESLAPGLCGLPQWKNQDGQLVGKFGFWKRCGKRADFIYAYSGGAAYLCAACLKTQAEAVRRAYQVYKAEAA